MMKFHQKRFLTLFGVWGRSKLALVFFLPIQQKLICESLVKLNKEVLMI